MFLNVPSSAGAKRVFDSVFSPAAFNNNFDENVRAASSSSLGFTTPTPRRPASLDTEGEDDLPEQEQRTWDRAWRVATSFLSIRDRGFGALAAFADRDLEGNVDAVDEEGFLREWGVFDPPSKDTTDVLEYLAGSGSSSSRGSEGNRRRTRSNLRSSMGFGFGAERLSKEYDLIEWFGNEMQRHFLKNFRAGLIQLLEESDEEGLLRRYVRYLQLARRIYFTPFVNFVLPFLNTTEQEKAFFRFRRSFHAIVAYSLPWNRTSDLLVRELTKEALVILGVDIANQEREPDVGEDGMDIDRRYSTSYRVWREETSEEARLHMMTEGEDAQVTAARERALCLLETLQAVGLGGNRAQTVFAVVMNNMMTEFVRAAYAGQWEGPSLVTQHLRHWIENLFARFVVEVLSILKTSDSESKPDDHLDVSLNDVEKWQEIGIARLGALRTSELFDVIVEWPASIGAIEDLKHFATHPAARFYVANSFISMLNQRLLHPGASTIEILQLYISIIRAFNLLDPKGVLLDRVARPIRRYLRDREDTIKVIVGGLLADTVDADGQPLPSGGETLVELSSELAKAHATSLQNDTGELDWDDMNWMPDPIDAAPDFRKSKNADVIGSLTSLFESKETFVKELQNTLAERLLKKRTDFDQEMSVLELLKVRFGDSALQACEVMLRDVLDSKRVDAVVRNDQGLARREPQFPVTPDQRRMAAGASGDMPQLHAKILSRFFWPNLQEQGFKVPDEISSLQQRYSAGFEALKQSRRLTWLNGLGQVTVELDLEDRVFVDEVTTWQATVIYAFQSDEPAPTTKTVAELSEQLQMSASLVRSACLFWVSKRILTEPKRDTFRVLEVLPNEEEDRGDGDASGNADNAGEASSAGAAAAADAAAAAAAKESADAAAMEKMNLYWQFIVGMLTNQGAMPLQRIVMMLKIAVPGGFPFSNEELREFLAGMVAQGKLEIVSGGSYKIVSS
ncbi:hypothetical protein VTN00DRAFT_4691 [Thermoascus crustaceus]|uniref:uncharacterized protein n=1 Tax=Thermoascus crustaceus TaxID=5088 RepID=UPI0037438656